MTVQKPPKLCPRTVQGAAGDPAADQLAVADDGVGAEVRQVRGLFGGTAAQRERLAVGGRGGAGAALVQEQHAVLLQGAAEPGGPPDETVRPEAGAALEVHQPRQVVPVGLLARDHLARVQLDRLPGRVGVVEGNGEAVVGEDDAGLAVGRGQRGSRDGRGAGRDPVQHMRRRRSRAGTAHPRPPAAERPVSAAPGWSAGPRAPAGAPPAGARAAARGRPPRSPPGAGRRRGRPW